MGIDPTSTQGIDTTHTHIHTLSLFEILMHVTRSISFSLWSFPVVVYRLTDSELQSQIRPALKKMERKDRGKRLHLSYGVQAERLRLDLERAKANTLEWKKRALM